MKILIVYGTTEGQTRKIADFVANRFKQQSEYVTLTDATDAVILNLWQATQLVIDLAIAACLRLQLGTPTTYADAFQRLAAAGCVEASLAQRLARAAGFRNVVAHAYGDLDLARVFEAASRGPANLRAFVGALATRV